MAEHIEADFDHAADAWLTHKRGWLLDKLVGLWVWWKFSR